MHLRALLLLFVLAAMPCVARGAPVEWLYDVQVPVSDQSAAERQAGVQRALVTLLARVTGVADLPRKGVIENALREPERYFVGYQYRRGVPPEPPLSMNVAFSPTAVRELVSEAGLPLWPRNRPNVLAWVAIDADGERHALGAGDGHPLGRALLEQARAHGLELRLPMMDPEDVPEIRVAELWNLDWPAIEEASARYAPDSVLVGRATVSSTGRWLVDWLYRHGEGERETRAELPTPEAAARAGLSTAVEELVSRYAVAPGVPTPLAIEIEGIRNLAGYGEVLRYLGTLEYVDSVQVEELTRDVLWLRVVARTDWPQFRDLLALDDRLWPVAEDPSGAPVLESPERIRLAWRVEGT